jgi:tetratricopeptide (TPR) repeat protein
MRNFLPYWYALAEVQHLMGNYRGALRAARRARDAHPGMWWPVGYELGAMAALGQVSGVLRRAEAMVDAPEDETHWTPAEALREAAEELRVHGFGDAAQTIWRDADHWYRSYGNRSGHSLSARDRLGWAYAAYALADYDTARRLARSLYKDFPQDVRVAGLLGTIAARRGELAVARVTMDSLAAIHRPYQFGDPAYYAALIAAALGDDGRAMQLLRRARAEGEPYGEWVDTEFDLQPLHGTPEFEALVRPVPLRAAD